MANMVKYGRLHGDLTRNLAPLLGIEHENATECWGKTTWRVVDPPCEPDEQYILERLN